MWTLKSVHGGDDPAALFPVTSSAEPIIKVGRHEDCQLHIASDQSVSRVHCHLYVNSVNEGKTEFTVVDCRSKFGTFINGQQVKPDIEHVLRHGDRIKFGAVNSEYLVLADQEVDEPPLSKRQVVELLLSGKSVPNHCPFKPRYIDRTLLFNSLTFRQGTNCDDMITQCGGRVTSEGGGEVWAEEEIYDAIIFGKLRFKPKTSVTVVAEFSLPPQPTKMITTKNTTLSTASPLLNVKRFRKVQPLSLPDIIGLADMAVHRRTPQPPTNMPNHTHQQRDENWRPESLQPPQPVHPEYQPKRPIEQYFDPQQPTKRAKPLQQPEPVSPQDFQTDFFKSLL